MRKVNYMKRAAKRFLEGTNCRIPVEAVEQGIKSLTEWSDILNEERERQNFDDLQRKEILERSRRIRLPNIPTSHHQFESQV